MGDRLKDEDWSVFKNSNGTYSMEAAHLVVLMDLRDELKKLNRLLHCNNFLRIPRQLERIKENTAPKKRRRRKRTTKKIFVRRNGRRIPPGNI